MNKLILRNEGDCLKMEKIAFEHGDEIDVVLTESWLEDGERQCETTGIRLYPEQVQELVDWMLENFPAQRNVA